MKIGLCAWSFTAAHREANQKFDPFIPEDLAQMAIDRGLQSIECSPAPLAQKSPAELSEFVEFLNWHQLDIILDTGSPNYHEDIAPLRETLEMAHRVGSTVIRTTISNALEGDRRAWGLQGWTEFLEALIEPFKKIMPLAARFGIHVGIENHQDLCSWELRWLCDQVGSPMLGSTMDCGNALAVGETPLGFAQRVLPVLKHIHIKDYTAHPTAAGYRFKRCAIGAGVVDWPGLFAAFASSAPQVQACIELGASSARHIRILEEDYWSTYSPRPPDETTAAIRILHQAARPGDEDWRTPHERGENARERVDYELDQLEASVEYLRGLT